MSVHVEWKRLVESLVKFRPKGEISLSYMDRLMMDFFLPLSTFFLVEHKEYLKKVKILTFYSLDVHYFRVHECFIGYYSCY